MPRAPRIEYAGTSWHAETRASRILVKVMEHFGLDEGGLGKTDKGDWRKVSVAWAICEHTTVRQGWIADRLGWKSATILNEKERHDQTGESMVDRRGGNSKF